MLTKEKIVVKEVFYFLSFIAVLVFCSYVVSHQFIDLVYVISLISYMIWYGLSKK